MTDTPRKTGIEPEFLTPAQAQTLLSLGKTAFYRAIRLARPPITPVTLPGMTEPRFRRADLLSLPDRVPGSARATGLPVSSTAHPDLSIYELRESIRFAEMISRGEGRETDSGWHPE